MSRRLLRSSTYRARTLRREATPSERALWKLLRRRQLGVKFRRQQPLGPYYADFFCEKARLVIEVDGAHHFPPPNHDRVRDEWLRAAGLTILRFPNQAVLRHPDDVLSTIRKVLARVDSPPLPPGEGDGG